MSEFIVPEATATLVLDEPPYAGAEIGCRLTLSPAIYFGSMQRLDLGTSAKTRLEQMTAAKGVAEVFCEHGLLSWNLADPRTHEPLPATVDGLLTLDLGLLYKIVGTWLGSLGTVPLPLSEASTTGGRKKATPKPRLLRSTGTSSTGASSRKRSTGRTTGASRASVG